MEGITGWANIYPEPLERGAIVIVFATREEADRVRSHPANEGKGAVTKKVWVVEVEEDGNEG
jgi:hypothetical protein